MDSRIQETQARIATQKGLKVAATLFKSLNKRYDTFLDNKPQPKRSLQRQFKEQSQAIDIFTAGRLISKDTIKEPNRSSKHYTTQWLCLERDENHPFEHFEEQLFPVTEILLSSRTPTKPREVPHAIFVKRHHLERIAQRLNKTKLEDILKPLHAYIKGLINYQTTCDREIENNKFIMITKDAYVVVKVTQNNDTFLCDSSYILTTLLPKEMWSKRRGKLLSYWIKKLNQGSQVTLQKGLEPILVLRPSLINSTKRELINFSDIALILG